MKPVVKGFESSTDEMVNRDPGPIPLLVFQKDWTKMAGLILLDAEVLLCGLEFIYGF
jgi:hypothetical protein